MPQLEKRDFMRVRIRSLIDASALEAPENRVEKAQMVANKSEENQEVVRLKRKLETERSKVRALSNELDATERALNTLLGRCDVLRGDLKTVNSTVERQAIKAALTEFNGNVTAVSRKLGMSRQSLYTKIKNYGIRLERKRRG